MGNIQRYNPEGENVCDDVFMCLYSEGAWVDYRVCEQLQQESAKLKSVLIETQELLRKSPAIKDTVWSTSSPNTTLYELIEIAINAR